MYGNSEWILHTFWKCHNENSWYQILLKFSNYESCNGNIVKFKSEEILLTLECTCIFMYMYKKRYSILYVKHIKFMCFTYKLQKPVTCDWKERERRVLVFVHYHQQLTVPVSRTNTILQLKLSSSIEPCIFFCNQTTHRCSTNPIGKYVFRTCSLIR